MNEKLQNLEKENSILFNEMKDKIKNNKYEELIELIDRMPKLYNPFAVPLRSLEQDKLLPAYCKMQAELQSVKANKINPAYKSKYANLDAILEAAKPILSKFEFSLIQEPEYFEGEYYLRTTLAHNSTQYRSTFVKVSIEKQTNQGYGSALSYQKRYSASTILGITTDDDPADDDGEYGRKAIETNENKPSKPTSPKKEILLSKNEIEYINDLMYTHDEVKKDLMELIKKNGKNNLEECPKKLFDSIVTFITKRLETKRLP